MTRFRSLALSITLALLVTGCYTQLRAPHASSQHRDIRVPTRRAHIWRHHRPVFHIPAYSHYDGWLYGDSYCDIWVDRYTDYYPWIPGHGVQVFFDVHAHPGRDVWRGNRYGRYHRRNSRNDYGGYGRHRGPRFEPLSPTIEITIEVVEHRGRFRRNGFAGGLPGKGEDLVTMQGSGLSADEGRDGRESTQTVRVVRPNKIERSLVRDVSVVSAADQSYLNRVIARESWERGRQTPTSQPALQTNWFNPNNTEASTAGVSEQPVRPEKRERVGGSAEANDKSSKPRNQSGQGREGAPSESWSTGATARASVSGTDYALPKKEGVPKREQVRRDRSPGPEVRDPKPASQTLSETKREKRERPTPNYAAPRKEDRSKERVSRASEREKSQKKETKKKDEEKKETRKEKRKKTRKRRGM